MNKRIILSFIAIVTVSLAFTGVKKSDRNRNIVGDYGNNSVIRLTINEDHSFQYVDASRVDDKLKASGKWTQKGDKILLEGIESKKGIPMKWKLDADYPCVKTRIGMKFLRICDCRE